MKPETVLIELVDRVGASPDRTVQIDFLELAGWPDDLVAALKSQRLLCKTRPASSTVCPGCEQECVMLVHTVASPSGPSGRQTGRTNSFIVCDKRGDINRVPVGMDRLIQWQCSTDSVCDFVADCLGVRPRRKRATRPGLLEIGMGTGEKHHQMLCLRTDDELELVAGSSAVPLAEILEFRHGRYGLKKTLVRQLVDASTTVDPRYTPSQARREARKLATRKRNMALQKAYRKLKRERPGRSDVWYARQIARTDVAGGLRPETIRKKMKK